MTLAERMIEFRKKNELSQRQAGELFGVSGSEIARIESGKNSPNIKTIGRWEKAFDYAERKMNNG